MPLLVPILVLILNTILLILQSVFFKNKEAALNRTRTECRECAKEIHYAWSCNVKFAAKMYGKSIPKYEDGTQWKLGDTVEFHTIIGNKFHVGLILPNVDETGIIPDECPLVVSYETDDEFRIFKENQITNVTRVHEINIDN